MCMYVCMCFHSNLLPHTLESRKRDTNGFIAIQEECAHLMHVKVFSIQMLQYFIQIVRRVCTFSAGFSFQFVLTKFVVKILCIVTEGCWCSLNRSNPKMHATVRVLLAT